jgi:hypothetical protein
MGNVMGNYLEVGEEEMRTVWPLTTPGLAHCGPKSQGTVTSNTLPINKEECVTHNWFRIIHV